MDGSRKWPIGAEIVAGKRAAFRVWAPKRREVEVVIQGLHETATKLRSEGNGYFSGHVAEARAGDLYRFRLDGQGLFPDPASRFQPEGPHGPSQLIDPSTFEWKHHRWKGVKLSGQVVYEMHIGTFTPEGTWSSAIKELAFLAELGVTVLEVMPVADFPGEFGWGYDGVNLFAPTRIYGSPDDFRRFIDAAHGLNIAVILDVVYNHVGPDGNYLGEFSDGFISRRYENEWGDALNFDGESSGPVREFFATNAAYWIDEFRLDGLRLDATQQIYDSSDEHILTIIGKQTREAAAGRDIILIAENERQEARLVRPLSQSGYGLDGMWNDDFHHSARVALTGRNEAYYSDYQGTSQELLSAVKWGFLFQGQYYQWQKSRRGHAALDLQPEQFVTFLENHDQVSNSAYGMRPSKLTSSACYRAMTALLLLAPGTPMLFQGQEFGSSSPFLFFADHNRELANLVAKGRAKFLSQFPSVAMPDVQARLPDPADRSTFEQCKLNWAERDENQHIVRFHQDLLRLRRTDPAFASPGARSLDGAVLSDSAFLLRFFVDKGEDRLLIVNFGRSLHLQPAPEPLLAPPEGKRWQVLWSSEAVDYGGGGTPPYDTDENWRILGEAAVVLVPSDRV